MVYVDCGSHLSIRSEPTRSRIGIMANANVDCSLFSRGNPIQHSLYVGASQIELREKVYLARTSYECIEKRHAHHQSIRISCTGVECQMVEREKDADDTTARLMVMGFSNTNYPPIHAPKKDQNAP